MERAIYRPRLLVFAAFLGMSWLPDVGLACKDRALDAVFPLDELTEFENVYIVHVTKVVPTRPPAESRYAPPFTFEGLILKSFKGPKKAQETLTGQTSSGEEPHARCPIRLEPGRDYLLMLLGQEIPFIVPRYGSPYVSSEDQYFRRYVAQIQKFYGTR